MITRIAPTPSGYLHEGNCVNFLLTAWLAESMEGTLALRIDDMDADRYRPEYVTDALRVLDWLGISWQQGPRSTEECEQSFSLRERTDSYRADLRRLQNSVLDTYDCDCSRSAARAVGANGCVGECRFRNVRAMPGRTATRVHVPDGTLVHVGDVDVDLSTAMGDFVVWRRDDRPAYQLASVVEDQKLGTTHFVRGSDLLASSAAQIYLASGLDADHVASAGYIHHPLVRNSHGEKLSKSQLAAGPLDTTPELRERVEATAAQMADELGIARR